LQNKPSSQPSGAAAAQLPETQVSTPLHTSSSLQSPSSLHSSQRSSISLQTPDAQGVEPAMQPWLGLQVSVPLQNTPSLHASGTPPVHVPFEHVSDPLHALPSSQCSAVLH
jgi:hypothetical protein